MSAPCPRCECMIRERAAFCPRCGLQLINPRRRAHPPALYLHEEVMLVALQDETGTINWRAGMYAYPVAGGILAELLLAGRIALEESKLLVDVVDPRLLGDPLLDEALQLVAKPTRRRRMRDWIGRLARLGRLKHRVCEPLCDQGILRQDEDRVLFIFPRRTYPTRDRAPEQLVVERLRGAILRRDAQVDARTTILLGLLKGANMLPIVVERKQLRARKAHVEALIRGDRLGRAAAETIQAIRAAIACSAAVAASTAAAAAAASG